jgi:hypothetical protein
MVLMVASSQFQKMPWDVSRPVRLIGASWLKRTSHNRTHHLLKTFYTGTTGWADQQRPDGTVIWTAPTGQTYTTTPAGSFFFPLLATPTGELTVPTATGPASEGRGVMMPARKRTRAQERRYRITHERRTNDARLAEEHRKHQAWLAATYEPPPF